MPRKELHRVNLHRVEVHRVEFPPTVVARRLASTRLSWVKLPAGVILPLFLWLIFASFNFVGQAVGQTGDFPDRKTLRLANDSEIRRIKALVREQDWASAASAAAAFMENPPAGLIQVPGFSQNRCRVFVSPRIGMAREMQNWATEAPESLKLYRERVDPAAKILFEASREQGDYARMRRVLRVHTLSRWSDDAALLLGRLDFERGNFLAAADWFDFLINDPDDPGRAVVRFPDAEIDTAQLLFESTLASILGQDQVAVARKMDRLEEIGSTSSFTWLQKNDLTWAQAKQILEREKSLLRRSRDVANSDPRNSFVDISGKPMWVVELPPESKQLSPYFQQTPSVADDDRLTLAYHPVIDERFAYWCSRHKVWRKRLSPDSVTELLWETPFLQQSPGTSRKLVGVPRFKMDVEQGRLFARMGDPITSYRNDSIIRNRTYLLALDLEKGAVTLPGFPRTNEDDPRLEFESGPYTADGAMYWITRRSFPDNPVSRLTLERQRWSPTHREPVFEAAWEFDWIQGESPNRGLWDESSRVTPEIVGTRIIFSALGFVSCVDRETGMLEWIADYPRDRMLESSAGSDANQMGQGESPRVNTQVQVCQNQVIVLPRDSERVFSFDLRTGRNLWSVTLPLAAHLLGITDGQLLLSGHQLHWIDLETGRLKARFPTTNVFSSPEFGLPSTRGFGRPVIDDKYIYWPTRDHVFVLAAELDFRERPRLHRIIDLRLRELSGGNLAVSNGIMLIATPTQLAAFGE